MPVSDVIARRQRHARVDEALEASPTQLEPLDPHRADLDDARARARRRSSRDRRRRSAPRSSGVSAGGDQLGEPDVAVADEAEPRCPSARPRAAGAVTSSRRRAAQGEQPACRSCAANGLAMRVQRIDEPVSATERELKLSVHEHMFA